MNREKSINLKYKTKYSSQNFWRENMMKLLECLYEQELTWSSDNWQNYGINDYSAKIIQKEFEKYLKKK